MHDIALNKMEFEVGDDVEAVGDPYDKEGFAGSWFRGKVVGKVLKPFGYEYLVEYLDVSSSAHRLMGSRPTPFFCQ